MSTNYEDFKVLAEEIRADLRRRGLHATYLNLAHDDSGRQAIIGNFIISTDALDQQENDCR